MNKNTLVVGFMLFAIFFGAGNLIFPPKLGFESGAGFWPAIIGFVVTGVGLPLLGIIVAARYEGGYQKALSNISPILSVLFLSAIYLTIGPFFAIPRTGATSYDLAIIPFIGEASPVSLLIFTTIYFGITLWVSLNPSKMVGRIGAILTPALLVAIVALVIRMVMLLAGDDFTSDVSGMDAPLFSGFTEGYQTMDALASFAFSVVVMHAVKAKSKDADPKTFFQQMAMAGVIAALALGLIYISLGWIGNNMELTQATAAEVVAKGQNLGTYILNTAATQAFGELGRALLGFIVTLACLTTSIGLVVATSEYFRSIFPRISYRTYALIFTLIGFAIANQGLNTVISKSVPVLLVLYPISMTALLVLLINLFMPLSKLSQLLAIVLVTVISIMSVAGVSFVDSLPLKAQSLEWLPFAIIGIVIGFVGKKVSN